MNSSTNASRRTASRAGALAAALALVLVALVGCSSSDDTADTTSTEAAATGQLVELDPDAFADAMAAGDGVVINVHIPYEGEIEGTDLFIAFDEILDSPDLPTEKDTRLLLYCRSDRMSDEAGRALVAAGYTDVSHLTGGMVAWEESGRTIVQDPSHETG